MVILYGDHYGISNSRNQALAPIAWQKGPRNWKSYNDDMDATHSVDGIIFQEQRMEK